MKQFIEEEIRIHQNYDSESVNEYSSTQNIYQIKHLDQETSQTYQKSEEDLEIKKLLDNFDNITKNNLSKNIINSFFVFLLDIKNIDLITDFAQKGDLTQQQALKKVKNYIQKYNFNNNSLEKLILHSIFGRVFEFYLTFEAQNWLNSSKVQQKDKHLVFINFLKVCCSNTDYLQNLVKYNKPKKSKYNDRI